MVLEITPPLEDRLRKLAARLQLDQHGVERWLLTVLNEAVPPECPATEEELLRRVNEGFPPEWWDRYRSLIARREAGSISQSELSMLMEMTGDAEDRHALRLEALAQLSELRGTGLRELMHQMGVAPEPLAAA